MTDIKPVRATAPVAPAGGIGRDDDKLKQSGKKKKRKDRHANSQGSAGRKIDEFV